jgi:hypothetical protein
VFVLGAFAGVVGGEFLAEEGGQFADGGVVDRIEVFAAEPRKLKRRGGMWKGQVVIADDFDTLPSDLAAAFGVGRE